MLMFEWDSKKAKSNEDKHGVSFEEASTVFFDSVGLDGEDLAHSVQEERRYRLGQSVAGNLFSFAEYPVACYGDEGEENPP